MQIGIVGGSGFMGSHLINDFQDFQIRNIDKVESKHFREATIIADVRDLASLTKALDGIDVVVLLAAEHHDNILPVSLYYDVNVQGMENVLSVMDMHNIHKIIFVSSASVYGSDDNSKDETYVLNPSSHYGKSKLQAEELLKNWYYKSPQDKCVTIVRPTVIFGEGNRGNVYNLMKQIATGRFAMIGSGVQKKSMAYIGNVVAFIKFCMNEMGGFKLYVYTDEPDLSMNELVELIRDIMGKTRSFIRVPFIFGLAVGYSCDIMGKILGITLPLSSVRVKKFCSATQFSSSRIRNIGFKAPTLLTDGLRKTIEYEFGITREVV